MKILIVTKSFFPLLGPRSFRATELAKSFSKQGHEVRVLTFYDKSHEKFALENGIEINHFSTYIFSKPGKFILKILNVLLIKLKLSEKLNFPDCLIFFTILFNSSKINNSDFIISIAKPHSINWGIAYLRKKSASKIKTWIADCGDPFYNNPFRKYSSIFKSFDKLFYEKVDYVTVPVDISLESYDASYLSKFIVIPQGFDIENDLKLRRKFVESNIVKFAYAGNFYKNNRDPKELISYLLTSKMDFRFYIYTNSKLVNAYIPLNDDRFIVSGFIERESLIENLSKLDFLISINNEGGVQSPSKLIDYGIAGRPILVLENNKVDGRLNEFLHKDYSNRAEVDLKLFDVNRISQLFINLRK
jgi:hypothetical protein